MAAAARAAVDETDLQHLLCAGLQPLRRAGERAGMAHVHGVSEREVGGDAVANKAGLCACARSQKQ